MRSEVRLRAAVAHIARRKNLATSSPPHADCRQERTARSNKGVEMVHVGPAGLGPNTKAAQSPSISGSCIGLIGRKKAVGTPAVLGCRDEYYELACFS